MHSESSDSPNVYWRQYIKDRLWLFVLILVSKNIIFRQYIHCRLCIQDRLSHIKTFLIVFVCKAWVYKLNQKNRRKFGLYTVWRRTRRNHDEKRETLETSNTVKHNSGLRPVRFESALCDGHDGLRDARPHRWLPLFAFSVQGIAKFIENSPSTFFF